MTEPTVTVPLADDIAALRRLSAWIEASHTEGPWPYFRGVIARIIARLTAVETPAPGWRPRIGDRVWVGSSDNTGTVKSGPDYRVCWDVCGGTYTHDERFLHAALIPAPPERTPT